MLQLALALCLITTTQASVCIPEYLQEITVNVVAPNGSGSGIIKKRGNDIYVVTVAHVLADLKIKRKKHAEQEMSKAYYTDELGFRDTHVIKELYIDGISVGRLFFKAKVIRYSEYEDLAVLRLYENHPLIKFDAVFMGPDFRYRVGDHIWHCGCFYGLGGINSISSGVVSYLNRSHGFVERDQTSAPIHPGSSGGGIFNDKGSCLGLAASRAEATYNYFIPMRHIIIWAKRVGVDFVFDDKLPIPTKKAFKKFPVEDNMVEDILDVILKLWD